MVSDRAAACPHCGAPPVRSAVRTLPVEPLLRALDPSSQFCLSCHSIVHAPEKARAPVWPGLLLLPAYLIPGIIYFVWRATTKQRVCPKCSGTALVPSTSHRAMEILNGEAGGDRAGLKQGDVSTGRMKEAESCPSCMLPVFMPEGATKVDCPHCTTPLVRTARGSLLPEDEIEPES